MKQMIYIRGHVCLTFHKQTVDKWSGAFGQGNNAESVNNDAAWFKYIYFDL